jgi:sirohydrochlorin cobaltochelatase
MDLVAQRILEININHCVRCAFLELSEPDLPSTVAELVTLGATEITVLPLFLGMGKHAREDTPLFFTQLLEQYPGIKFIFKPSVGENPRVIDFLAQLAVS